MFSSWKDFVAYELVGLLIFVFFGVIFAYATAEIMYLVLFLIIFVIVNVNDLLELRKDSKNESN